MAVPTIKDFTTLLADLVAEGKTRMTAVTNWATGAVVHSILAVCAKGLEALYQALQRAIDLAFADTSEGVYLERIAAQLGVDFQEAVKAQGTVTFSRDDSTGAATVPAGTIVGVVGGVRFIVDAEVTAADGEDTIDAEVTAQLAGIAGNAGAGTIAEIVSVLSGWDAVTNGEDWLTREGDDAETEAEWAARVALRWAAFAYGASAETYESHARESTGVALVKVNSLAPRGEGTVDVVVTSTAEDGVPTPELIEAIQDTIDARKPVDADVLVKAPTLVEVDVHVRLVQSLTGGDAATIEAEAEAAIGGLFQYTTAVLNFGIGDDVILAKLFAACIAVAHVDNVVIVEPAADVELGSDQLAALGTLTVEVI
jgi:uncharacterized phage protein gp47/JayE